RGSMRQVSLGRLMYSTDNDDRWSLTSDWIDRSEKYAVNGRIFDCPSVRRNQAHYRSAMEKILSGKPTADMERPDTQVLTFETNTLVRNASGDSAKEAWPSRH